MQRITERALTDVQLSELPVSIMRDESKYHVIDGEEGDFGIVKWYSVETKELLFIYKNNGGDDYFLDFTKAGLDLLKPLVIKKLEEQLAAFEVVKSEQYKGEFHAMGRVSERIFVEKL